MSTTSAEPKNGYRYQAIGYLRVSKEEAWSGSHTLSTQEVRIRVAMDAHFGAGQYDLKLFQDDGVSGAYGPEQTGIEKRTRPTLKTIIGEIQTGLYDAFTVYDLSRFSRSDRWLSQIYEDVLAPSKTTFISACEAFDLDDPHGRAQANFLSMMNKLQRDTIIKRTRDAGLHRAQLGYLLGQPGYGWQWQPLWEVTPGGRRGIIPVEEQAKVILHVKDRLLAGWNMSRIVAELNTMQVPSPAGLPTWHVAVLQRIMKNPLHAGFVPSRKGEMKGQHWEQRFYDPEVREQILEVFAAHKRFPTNTAWASHLLLNGIVCCSRCGKRLYATGKTQGSPTFSCLNGLSSGRLLCPGVRITQDVLDETVLSKIEFLSGDTSVLALLRAEAETAISNQDADLLSQQEQLRNLLAQLESQFQVWADAFTLKRMAADQFESLNQKLLAQRTEAREQLRAIEATLAKSRQREDWVDQIVESIATFKTKWPHLHLNERKSFLAQIIEKLSIDRSDSHTTVRIKLHLTPEQEILIPRQKPVRPKKTATGVAGLTQRHLALLYWLAQDQTPQEAAMSMGATYNTIRQFVMQIRKLMRMHDLQQIAEVAQGRICAELSTLPIHGLRSPQVAAQQEGVVYLSPKLMQVFPLFLSGAKNKRIAELTGLSVTVVKGRYTRILDLFGVKDMYDAGQKARAMGLL